MSNPKEARTLSAEELRSKLYSKFKDKGIINDLRSQVRSRLVSELHTSRQLPLSPRSTNSKHELLLRITNWFIVEHLQKLHYHYTLSLFDSECERLDSSEAVLTISDVLNLLQVPSDTAIYQVLISNKNHATEGSPVSHLLFLLSILPTHASESSANRKMLTNAQKMDQGVQTDNKISTNIQQKLQEIEEFYHLKKGSKRLENERTIEGQLLVYQQQMEERIRREAKAEMELFRERELIGIKVEASKKCSQEIKEQRQKLEEQYQSKVVDLLAREKADLDNLRALKESEERDIYQQRQELLDQLELARQKESSIQRRSNQLNEERLRLQEKEKSIERRRKMNEDKLSQEERMLDHKVNMLVSQEREQEQREYTVKLHDLEQQKIKLEYLQSELTDKMKHLALQEIKQQQADKLTNELENKLMELQNTQSLLKTENESLRIQLMEKEELTKQVQNVFVMKTTISNLESRITEFEQEKLLLMQQLNELRQKISLPSPQLLQVTKQLDQVKDSYNLDQAVWEEQRHRLQLQLAAALERNSSLAVRLKQQAQVFGEQQTVGKSRLNRNGSRNQLFVQDFQQQTENVFSTPRHQTFYDTSINPEVVPPELQLYGEEKEASRHLEDLPRSFGVSSDNAFNQTRNRLLMLEQEALNLDNCYRKIWKGAGIDSQFFPEVSEGAESISSNVYLDHSQSMLDKNKSIFNENKLSSSFIAKNDALTKRYAFPSKVSQSETMPFEWSFSYQPHYPPFTAEMDILHSTMLSESKSPHRADSHNRPTLQDYKVDNGLADGVSEIKSDAETVDTNQQENAIAERVIEKEHEKVIAVQRTNDDDQNLVVESSSTFEEKIQNSSDTKGDEKPIEIPQETLQTVDVPSPPLIDLESIWKQSKEPEEAVTMSKVEDTKDISKSDNPKDSASKASNIVSPDISAGVYNASSDDEW